MPFRFNPFTDRLDLTETGGIPPGGGIQTITGNTGGAVGPDMSNNVNLLGSGAITVTGNAGTNTLTISLGATVATTYTANTGSATPALNNLNVLATVAAAGTTPFTSTGAGSTITYTVQTTQAAGASAANIAGIASFSNTQFSVDANGFVTLSGTGVGQTITGNTGGALSPTAGNWNILGATVAAGTTPVATAGSGSTLTVNVQRSQAIASTNATNVGLAAFNSAQFTVDANGFVSSLGLGVPWIDQGTSITLANNTGYFATAAVTLTLPASPVQGTTIKIICDTASTVVLTANTGQTIRQGNLVSSTAGTFTNSLRGDALELFYRAATTQWIALNGNGTWLAA